MIGSWSAMVDECGMRNVMRATWCGGWLTGEGWKRTEFEECLETFEFGIRSFEIVDEPERRRTQWRRRSNRRGEKEMHCEGCGGEAGETKSAKVRERPLRMSRVFIDFSLTHEVLRTFPFSLIAALAASLINEMRHWVSRVLLKFSQEDCPRRKVLLFVSHENLSCPWTQFAIQSSLVEWSSGISASFQTYIVDIKPTHSFKFNSTYIEVGYEVTDQIWFNRLRNYELLQNFS